VDNIRRTKGVRPPWLRRIKKINIFIFLLFKFLMEYGPVPEALPRGRDYLN
jgi:hypothetical protein